MKKHHRWLPWAILIFSELFFMAQASLQLNVGMFYESIQEEFQLSAFAVSLLGSVYYCMYIGFQVPAGLIMDRVGARWLLPICAFICAVGSVVFALTHSYYLALFAKFCIGGAAAFAFVGVIYLIREWFPAKMKATLVATTEILSMFAAIRAVFLLHLLLHYFNWRAGMLAYGFYFLIAALGCAIFIKERHVFPKRTLKSTHGHLIHDLKSTIKNPIIWLNGLYAGLTYSIVTVFTALWAPLFFKYHLGCSPYVVSKLLQLTTGGVLVGCLLFSWLSQKYRCRRPFLLIPSICAWGLFTLLVYGPSHSLIFTAIMTFLLGLSAGSYVLAFLISEDIAPMSLQNTYMGFTNACCLIITPFLQPLIGFLLDLQNSSLPALSHIALQWALSPLFVVLFLAIIIAWRIPETFRMPESTRSALN